MGIVFSITDSFTETWGLNKVLNCSKNLNFLVWQCCIGPIMILLLIISQSVTGQWSECDAPTFSSSTSYSLLHVTTFPYSKLLQYLFYSLLWPDRSRLISYNILTALSVSLTADFSLIDYFSHDYLSWLITYDILSQIDLVCVPNPLVYKPSVQTVFFSFDLG